MKEFVSNSSHKIDVDKIDIENFKTIQELAKYIESKLQAKES